MKFLSYKVISNVEYESMKEQIKAKSDIEIDAPHKISNLENAIERKNQMILFKDKELETNKAMIELLNKINTQLATDLDNLSSALKKYTLDLKEQTEINKKLEESNKKLLSKCGGLTKSNNDLERKINNFKEMIKASHIQLKPSEYDNRQKIVKRK